MLAPNITREMLVRDAIALIGKGLVLVVLVCEQSVLLAQNPIPRVSPQVHPDRTVTFRLSAPQAHAVAVRMANIAASSGKLDSMVRASNGTWSVTLGPFEPEIYEYSFVVDGTAVLDGSNPFVKPGDFGASLLEVPGSPPRIWESQNVAHGSLELLQYQSTPYKVRRNLYVYLPPQYYSEPSRRFPILYLRHGNGDYEVAWPFEGRAGVILENLIALNKAVPMIIVMPYGESTATGGASPAGMVALDEELHKDIMPLVERHFRALVDRQSRAIAGLSMGGRQAMTIGLRHLNEFAFIGAFSSGGVPPTNDTAAQYVLPLLPSDSDASKALSVLYLSCGTDDPRYPFHLELMSELKARNIKFAWSSMSGAHEFKVWRQSLSEFLPMLFQSAKK
jgi:enterochelin esterase-like enzyme